MNWSTSCCHGVCCLLFFHIPKYFILLSPWNLEDLGFSLSQDSYHWPVHQTTSSSELQPQNKYTIYQTKGALFKSQSLLAASSSHTIIPRANYKSFALDTTHYLKCVKLAITTILVKWSTARKGLCCRCNTFHRDSFKIQELPSSKLEAISFLYLLMPFFCFFSLVFLFVCLFGGVGLGFFGEVWVSACVVSCIPCELRNVSYHCRKHHPTCFYVRKNLIIAALVKR